MITFEEALNLILKNTPVLSTQKIPLEQSVGRVLKEDIYSTIDMPPFNKSAMDGYAVIAKDTQKTPVKLKCIGNIQAGEEITPLESSDRAFWPTGRARKLKNGECVKIMTGAPLPNGADSVVMIENTKQKGKYIEISESVKKGENVCKKGEDIKQGKKIFNKGTRISSSHIAILATIGKKYVNATKIPQVAILNTGGEIVPLGRKLGKNQIYNSNGPQLVTLLKSDTVKMNFLGIAEDKPDELTTAIKKGLKNDMLLISGGVSMGDYDLVPEILKNLGVKKIFHKVNIKPGKPLFFGGKGKTVVFGIPGNPVSNFLAYLIFIQPALYKMMGYESCKPKFQYGITTKDFRQKQGRKHFVLVSVSKKGNNYYLNPVPSHGSADIMALSKANGFMIVDSKSSLVKNHSKLPFITWEK